MMEPEKALELYGELNRLGALSKLMQSYFITFPLHRELHNEDVGIRKLARFAAGKAFMEFGKGLKGDIK